MAASLRNALTDARDLLETCLQQADWEARMESAIALTVNALKENAPLLVCGNGGSMADALHISGELTARFRLDRPGLPVIALGCNPSTLTAWSNDVDYTSLFAREVEAYGRSGAVVLGISTSGNSKNVLAAFEKARKMGLSTIALTGQGGGQMAAVSDVLLDVPSRDTPAIQQVHLVLYHHFCEQVEAAFAQ